MRVRVSSISLIKSIILVFAVLSMVACSSFVSKAKKDFAQDLTATILEFDDPETIKKAVPAYLVLISSLIRDDPENIGLLESGAQLYGAYASGFADSDASKKALANRA
ncbi:MAG: hypothetical protein KAI17_11420, partial [Thiotrichaceae bacterium]|nr:hypothetical protein [Thiotrichaceae bacterium]